MRHLTRRNVESARVIGVTRSLARNALGAMIGVGTAAMYWAACRRCGGPRDQTLGQRSGSRSTTISREMRPSVSDASFASSFGV